MVITLKIELNNGETVEYSIFPCELTRELIEKHIDGMLDSLRQTVQQEFDPDNMVNYVLENFKMGHKIIYNDGIVDETEQLVIFNSLENIVANFVRIHETENQS